ncbi:MAG: anti-sigma factor [Rhodothermales bacterium]
MSNPLDKPLAHNEDVSKDRAIEALHTFLDGELPVEDQSGLFAHLAACSNCRQELEGVMKFRRMSRSENLTVPPSLDAAMFKRLQKHKVMMKKIDRAEDRRPLWNTKAAVSLRATVVTAMLVFLTGLLIPANNLNGYSESGIVSPVYGAEGVVTGSDEFIEFTDLDFLSNTSTIYVFYPGLTVEAVSENDAMRTQLP